MPGSSCRVCATCSSCSIVLSATSRKSHFWPPNSHPPPSLPPSHSCRTRYQLRAGEAVGREGCAAGHQPRLPRRGAAFIRDHAARIEALLPRHREQPFACAIRADDVAQPHLRTQFSEATGDIGWAPGGRHPRGEAPPGGHPSSLAPDTPPGRIRANQGSANQRIRANQGSGLDI